MLISRIQEKDICLRKVLPYLLCHILFLLTSCHYWQSLAGSTAVCLSVCQCLGHTRQTPYLWGFCTPAVGTIAEVFLGSGLHCDVGIPNAWAVFRGYVLNFVSLALEVYTTLACCTSGFIYERECRLGKVISMQDEMESLTLTFLPDSWFRTNPWKASFATRKYCQFCQITFLYDVSCQGLMNCCRKQCFYIIYKQRLWDLVRHKEMVCSLSSSQYDNC